MNDDEVLEKVKTNLRISHTKLDGDLSDTIAACKADLQMSGVRLVQVDALILNAIKLYCRAAFSDSTAVSAAYMESYKNLKSCMMLASEYREGDSGE